MQEVSPGAREYRPNGPSVVILGGGFGGLHAARALRHAPVRVTLVDRRNHHLFQPLLYQVATATLNPSDIASPIRSMLRGQRNVSVVLAEAISVHVGAKRVILADGAIAYDYLIVSTGATHSYFDHNAWATHAPGLKSIKDALEIRRRVFVAYEAAERETDPGRRRDWMTFVIIGAGPTGVELAGALAEISRHALDRDFRNIDPRRARIVLVEALRRVLPTYPAELSAKARRQLERLGVEVRTDARVTEIDEAGVSLLGVSLLRERRIGARTVIWAAGVAASPLARELGAPLDRAGRVLVNPDLTVPGRDDIFVIGDLAALVKDARPIPGVASAAIQEGRHAARNIVRALHGEPCLPFRYRDKGSFATIGRGAAVGELLGRFQLSGFLAWLGWVVIHLYFLMSFRNRLLVMFHWAYSYLTYRRGARLITGLTRPRMLGAPEGERESRPGTRPSASSETCERTHPMASDHADAAERLDDTF